jgi:two-component system response regulator (stage 0 sporulation protein A)
MPTERISSNYDTRIFTLISDTLNEIGLFANLSGYQFLREGIYAKWNDVTLINKDILQFIAKMHNTNPNNVNSLMRHALRVAWTDENMQILNKKFGVNYFYANKPMACYQFISTIADLIALQKSDKFA